MFEHFLSGRPAQPERPRYWNRTRLLRGRELSDVGLRIAVAIAFGAGYENKRGMQPGLRQVPEADPVRLFTNLRLLREAVLIESPPFSGAAEFHRPQSGLVWAVDEGVEMAGFERLAEIVEQWDPRRNRFVPPRPSGNS